MTSWELQLCANAHGKATATLAWMTAGFQRTQKLKPLDQITKVYDPVIEEEIIEQTRQNNLFEFMKALADQDAPDGE